MDKNPDPKTKEIPVTEQKYTETPLLALCFGGGLAGFLLRLYMNLHCFAENGFLHRGCVVYTLLIVLSLLVLGGLAWFSRGMGSDNHFRRNYSPSTVSGAACFLAAVSFLAFAISSLGAEGDAFHKVTAVLGFLSIPCLAFIGISRLDGKRCAFLFPMGVCLFLAFRLICEFRHWNTIPEIADYCFALLANVAAMLSACHFTGFSLDQGSRRRCLFFSLAAVYFSLITLADGGTALLFYAGTALFMLGTLPRLKKPHRRRPGGQVIPND